MEKRGSTILLNPGKNVMNRRAFFILVVLIAMLDSPPGFSQDLPVQSRNPYAITTFECAGLYWKAVDKGPCRIKYRQESERIWKDGLDLVYDEKRWRIQGKYYRPES